MVTYDKPFLDKKEMLNKLRYEKNLIINNEDFADEVIRKLSYYDLVNGSKEAFIDTCPDGKEIFKPNTTIEDLYNFHMVNNTFQNIIVRRLFMIETLFKNELAYVLAKNFGVDTKDYLNKLNYRKYIKTKKGKKLKVEKILSHIFLNIPNLDDPTRHYNLNHNHIPPWILLKNIKFYDAIQIFESLNNKEKSCLANRLIDNDITDTNNINGIIKNMLNITRLYRNEIVHNYKFITFKDRINVSVKNIKHLTPFKMLEPNNNGKNVYTVILCILILLGSDRLRISFINDIILFLETRNIYDASMKNIYDTYFNLLDLPNDFRNKIFWYRKFLINKDRITNQTTVHANYNSKIYHLPGDAYYNKISKRNLIIFNSEIDAIKDGYRKSKI